MAQLKDTSVNGGLSITGDLVIGSNDMNVEEEITDINNSLKDALGKKFYLYTKTAETINDSGYHGAGSPTTNQNDYSSLFTVNSGGGYFTYNGTKSCIISGYMNVKLVKSGANSYVHLRSGIYNTSFNEDTIVTITPCTLDDSGRWYMIPFMFTINKNDKFWFLYTHSSSSYVKVEEMKFNLKIESFI